MIVDVLSGLSLARMVTQVQPNNACLRNCEGKAGTGLRASHVTWNRETQEQLKSCEGTGSQGK